MACTIYLVRHAIAEEYSASGRDADRELTAEGREKMQRAALGLKKLELVPELVWSSPLPRAAQTARIVCDALAPKLLISFSETLAPGGQGKAVLNELARIERAPQSIMLVGHEPDLGQLASLLLTGSSGTAAFAFKKGAIAAIEVDELSAHAHGQLLFFLTPKQMRALVA